MALKVMVVDDEQRIRKGIEAVLKRSPLEIEIVGSYSNGREALTHVIAMEPGDLDVLITDIEMPFMDGLSLIEHVRKRLPELQTIVLSGYSEFEYARKAFRLGVTDYLLKPVEKSQLFRLLEACGKKPPQPEAADAAEEGPGGNTLVAQIHRLLEQEYANRLDLKRLATAIGFSPSYISHQFSQKTGETITDYLNRLRIEKAKRFLLDHPDLKMYEVAQTVGYADAIYFHKMFKKLTGITPREFKERGGN
ncbi:helix-turn-helix domain-containing protein [Paenibacillus sp.]|uniref:helix-turn-helix domain-containing protein n=1 Tax=Paenibacillus sp. TaxID=58172 RepID=UPI002D2EAB72|nr:helix-turn-helix domain-containing protein [Paenibacillus sp.]HZG55044.1 helix-turn-helix domain-containing protein [Paenibacillus sp.]